MGLGSGIHRALEAWPHIQFENHERGNEFKAIIARTYMAEETDQATDPVIDPVTDSVLALINVLSEATEPLAPSVIQEQLGLKHRPTFRANYLYPALEAGLIEMTIPEKPNSRLQAYRLTELGQSEVEGNKKP